MTALITPFENGELDIKSFKKIVNFQIDNGTDGLIPVGTTGESPTLSHYEHEKIVEECIKVADNNKYVLFKHNVIHFYKVKLRVLLKCRDHYWASFMYTR